MKNGWKKFLALALAVGMAFSLAACGNTANTPSDAPSQPAADTEQPSQPGSATPTGETFKIGYNYFGTGPYALAALANQSQIVLDVYGDESISSDNQFSVEKIISDVENMISSGCDGIIIWLPAEPLYEVVAKMCDEAGVYFVLNDKIPASPEVKETLLNCEHFAGAIAPANAEYGKAMAEYAIAQGWKTCITTSSAEGDATDQPRLDAFQEAFEAAGGTILSKVHSETTADSLPNIQDALIACDEPDFIYGVGSEYAMSACTALENYPSYGTKVITSGLEKEALSLLLDESSPLVTITGDYWVAGMFSAIVLQNACAGNKLVDADGKAIWVDDIMPFEVTPETYPLYEKYFLDESVYTTEEIQALQGISYDVMMTIINDYSLENRLQAKHAAGIISDDEMAAAGLK